MTVQDKKNLSGIAQAIFDKKGMNIIALDVRGVSTMTDYFIIAEGSVDRHVKSLCMAIKGQISESKMHLYYVDGERDAEWIVMDCGDVVVHLFIPEMREKYALESLWSQAKIVDLDIVVAQPQK